MTALLLQELWPLLGGVVLGLWAFVTTIIVRRERQQRKSAEDALDEVQKVREHENELATYDDVHLADVITRGSGGVRRRQ